MSFFDSLPTTQSRLLTFRCPNADSTKNKDHFITIAWRAKNPKLGEGISILAENVRYVGKPLALLPSAIENYEENTFPQGTFYASCTCLPKKNGKVCYVSTDIVNAALVLEADQLKASKKIRKDIQVSNQMLIQLFDLIETLQENQAKNQKTQKQFHQKLAEQVHNLETRVNGVAKVLLHVPDGLKTIMEKLNHTEKTTTSTGQQLLSGITQIQEELLSNKMEQKLANASKELTNLQQLANQFGNDFSLDNKLDFEEFLAQVDDLSREMKEFNEDIIVREAPTPPKIETEVPADSTATSFLSDAEALKSLLDSSTDSISEEEFTKDDLDDEEETKDKATDPESLVSKLKSSDGGLFPQEALLGEESALDSTFDNAPAEKQEEGFFPSVTQVMEASLYKSLKSHEDEEEEGRERQDEPEHITMVNEGEESSEDGGEEKKTEDS